MSEAGVPQHLRAAICRCLDDGLSVTELDHSLGRLRQLLCHPVDLEALVHESCPRARECVTCGRVQPADDVLCTRCGSPLVVSRLPQRIAGRLEIEERVGKGATGLVYRGVDLSLGRRVAIKTLVGTSRSAVSRLRYEAQALAAVSHRHLVAVYGFEVYRGQPLILLEWLDGGTLADRVPLPLGPAIDAMLAAADALACLHQAGFVHRDVKPRNIGFTGQGELRLLDLGLARPSDADVGSSISPPFAGTLAYMSPEALNRGVPGPAFDVWSLDVVFYELVTAVRPFSGRDSGALVEAVREGRWRPLDSCLCSAMPALHEYFAAAFDPSRRPADGAEQRQRLLELRRELDLDGAA